MKSLLTLSDRDLDTLIDRAIEEGRFTEDELIAGIGNPDFGNYVDAVLNDMDVHRADYQEGGDYDAM